MEFCDSYRCYFRAARHNLSEKARCYLAGLMMKAPRKNMERMQEYVEQYDYQNQQQFISDSPWDHGALARRVGGDVDEVLGGPESVFIVDESAFRKKGSKSAGVARQWNGRDGKVDNCQVGVFGALCEGNRASLVDLRLFLPECWSSDPQRCQEAKIPPAHRQYRSKAQLAKEIINDAVGNGLHFGWVALDSFYGSHPWLLRDLDDWGLRFVADVHRNQGVYPEEPAPYLPRRKKKRGPKFTKLRARSQCVEIGAFFENVPVKKWQRIKIRESTKGTLRVRACRRLVWLWDGEEKQPRRWWAVCLFDESTAERKWFLSNADARVSLSTLVRKHAVRYWIERSFQDAKSSVGMGDYQVRGWIGWHHHMALVMLAMIFLLRERKSHEKELDLLSCQDIVELLNVFLPRADTTKEAVIKNMKERHRRRRQSIDSARRISGRSNRPRPFPT